MNNNYFKNAIALTGGIATGKSTVCNLLKLHGFLTIDADTITHELLNKNSPTISNMFGPTYIKNGKVLRKKLGHLIFNNKEEKQKLESFIHPLIKEEIIKQAKIFEKANKPYIIDIPLFFETNQYTINKSLVVYAPYSLQCERLIKRDKITEKEAKIKISNQMDIESKKKLASLCIDNSSTLKNLQNEVEKIITQIL